jgi:hypothetical protein
VTSGSVYNYLLSGTGVTTADVVNGALTGTVTIGADGIAYIPVSIASDVATEGAETLTLNVAGRSASVTINDTSVSSAPAGLNTTATVGETITGTSGDDIITTTAANWNAGDVINGGAGNDTLNATITGTAPQQSATSLVSVETLNLTASPNPATIDLAGVTGVTSINNISSANGATVAVSSVGNVVNTTITGGNTSTTIGYTTAAVAGTADAATLTLNGTAAGSSFVTSGVETLTVASNTAANTLTALTDTGITRLNVTGTQALTIGGTVGGTTLATVNTTGTTGAVTMTLGGVGSALVPTGVSFTGGAGATTLTTGGFNDTVVLGNGNNTVNTGAGNDVISTGTGTNTVTPGAGNDTLTLNGSDTVRFEGAGATTSDTINGFSLASNDVLSFNLGSAQTSTAAASANATFGTLQTGGTSPVMSNVNGAGTATAISFQSVTANATATSGTVLGTSNVLNLAGTFTDGTATGVVTALGTTAGTGITTTATGKFLLVTYSVGNIAQVWAYSGDTTVNTDIDASELSLVATLSGVAPNSLTAAAFSTWLSTAAASSTVVNTGSTVNLTGTLNTVQGTANASGQLLSAGNDTINVAVGTLPAAAASTTVGLTIIDPSAADADVLNATNLTAASFSGGATLISGIETINLNMLVANTTFSAAAITPGTTAFGLTGSQNFVVTGMPNGGAITLGSGYTGVATETLISDTGTADSIVVNLAGSVATSASAGASLVYTQNAVNAANVIETATVNVSAASSIRTAGNDLFAAADVDGAGASTAKVVTATSLAGTGSLTIFGAAADLGTLNLNGSGVGYSGALTLRPSTDAAMDFSTNTSGAGLVTGISTIDLQDVSGYSNAITIAGTNTTNTSTPVTISFAPSTASGFTTIGGMTVAKTGGTQSDVVNLSLGANAASVASGGTFTATTIETLNITSARASTGTLTLGNITLTDGPGTQVVNLTAASTVAAGTITADTVNFSGVTGAVTGVTLANTAGVSFVGGSGNTVVVGSSSADLITTGAGNDTITPAGGADVITTGAGNDRVNFTASAAIVIVAPVITDFSVGTTTTVTDSIAISQGNTFGGGAVGFTVGGGAAGALAAVALGSLTVVSVANSTTVGVAATAAGTASFVKLSSTVAGVGATAQAVFNAALGTASVSGYGGGGTEVLVVAYDATAGRALILDVDAAGAGGTSATTVDSGDTVLVIGSITMTAADYANFGVNNILTY